MSAPKKAKDADDLCYCGHTRGDHFGKPLGYACVWIECRCPKFQKLPPMDSEWQTRTETEESE